MRWLKDNWLAVAVVVGIIVSLALVRHDASSRADHDRKATVLSQRTGCIRTGVQKALSAAGWLRAAEARRADGNEEAARYYEGIADGMILTIPAPSPATEGQRFLAEVRPKHIAGRTRYVLTPYASQVQRAGCEHAYPLS